MRYLKISNTGELDIRLVALMGGTTKSKNKYKLGQFGTGLKYTLAWLFRNNVDFKIFVGENQVKVSTVKEEIRGEVFEIICIDKKRTSITTGMGLEWKAWMIIRELWCNALDEGNAVKSIIEKGKLAGELESTVFYIQITPDIQEVLDNWNKHFISEDEEPVFENSNYRLYTGGGSMCIYKNGVLIHENATTNTVFRYDILDASINELREYKGSPACDISKAIKQLNPIGIKYFLDHVTPEYYEGNNMDYNWYTEWGESWQTFIMSTKLLTENIRHRFSDNGYSYNERDYTLLPQCVYDSLTKSIGGIEELQTANNTYNFYEVESTETEDKIKSCIQKLSMIGYTINPSIVFSYGFFEHKETLIVKEEYGTKLMISIGISQKSVLEIMKMLMEKNEEVSVRLYDTTKIKNHFINLYLNELLDRNGNPFKEASPDQIESEKALWAAFILTMPNVGSWDGKWTGGNDLHCKIQMVKKNKLQELLGSEQSNSWHYNFGDGWSANVKAKVVTDEEIRELQQANKGMMGYDWMIESILEYGEILTAEQRRERRGKL